MAGVKPALSEKDPFFFGRGGGGGGVTSVIAAFPIQSIFLEDRMLNVSRSTTSNHENKQMSTLKKVHENLSTFPALQGNTKRACVLCFFFGDYFIFRYGTFSKSSKEMT